MLPKNIYNKVSDSYSSDLNKIVFGQSRQVTLQQIKKIRFNKDDIKIIDLGVGHGEFLKSIKQVYNKSILTGVDLSGSMLAEAKKNVDFEAIEERIEFSPLHVNGGQYDLVACHFICCYVGLPKVLQLASYLLKDKGLLSLCTTTCGAWPKLQAFVNQKKKGRNPLKRVLFKKLEEYYYNDNLTPQDFDEIANSCQQLGFKIIEHNNIAINLRYESLDHLLRFFIEESWGAHACHFPRWFYKILGRYLFSGLKFPFDDQQFVSVCLIES